MNITQNLVPKGRKNRPGRANKLQYITIHNTGNTSKGANAKSHANYIKGDTAAKIPVSWHYTVDDKEIIQHIPDNEIAWHAGDGGSGTGNNASIGIEICMNSDGDIKKATDLAVDLVAYLCKKHGIKVENVVQHNRWSGKDCPQLLRRNKPYSFTSFVDKVRAKLSGTSSPPPATTKPATGFSPYLVRVTASALNIRKGAGTNHAVTGVIRDKGTYTIVEEASGTGAKKWGKLKSGAGWIGLDHTTRV